MFFSRKCAGQRRRWPMSDATTAAAGGAAAEQGVWAATNLRHAAAEPDPPLPLPDLCHLLWHPPSHW